ncbi:TRAP transporter substrate-binding protein [Eilatimonas milleporae]|uniref:TRAP-type mannitol/chloroaromatic compound transport system substrate-binding protein n=1 Tax=Eilatimonas milleporae TaxID=911205 RepID=A0A3M0CY71_9PROT|nr:TRAP transporter substrate-binding protein [Eilatimonas milleporae]RMB08983.1 TRAP-type mannitol/chloroaromatic compound transport system substrate-binding protein [Eilatimonas milleporae]
MKATAFSIFLKRLVLIIPALTVACGQQPETDSVPKQPEEADTPVTWRLSSTYPSTLLIIGTMGKRVTEKIHSLSGERIDLAFYEPGVLAPPFETFDAVSYGAIEAGWSTSGYWAGKEPALQLFSSVPFGPAAPEYLAWYDHGGGRALFERIYHRHNIHGIICGLSPPEASGWFKREITGIEDFQGLKIRFFGLGGKVLEKVGAAPQLIAGGEIYQALELGTIDASEYAMPAVDYRMGLHEVAKHYYLPGWHQQSTFFELIINLDAWNGLSPHQQSLIEAACSANIREGLSEGEALQTEAMSKIAAAGVTIHTWSPEILQSLETAWMQVADELAEDDATFAEVWASLQAFRETYRGWFDRGYLRRSVRD